MRQLVNAPPLLNKWNRTFVSGGSDLRIVITGAILTAWLDFEAMVPSGRTVVISRI
jgi:hypothetical protein